MKAFLLSLGMVFAAEFGDKTQLVAMGLATRFSARIVLAGILVATLLVHAFSVLLGGCAGGLLPTDWVHFVGGLAFVGFGLWSLRGDCASGEDSPMRRSAKPFLMVLTTFFLSELGDKTMFTTVWLAAAYSPVWVWLGSTLGMVLSDGIAIVAGRQIGQRVPERAMKIATSVIFFGFGMFGMVWGGARLPLVGWALGAAVLTLFGLLFARGLRTAGSARETQSQEEPQVARVISGE